jgi:(p)ppGpp synthase/HD superfamily hydrolase
MLGKKETAMSIVNSLMEVTTLNLIQMAHGSQMYGSQPYWKHPQAVAKTGKRIFGAAFNITAVQVALLHDVVEDTPYDLAYLESVGYSTTVLAAVALVTKDKSLSYDANIHRIIASGNKVAMMVKFADNYENYTGDKSHWTAEKAARSQAKYKKSMQMLAARLKLDDNFIPQ